jgi:adenine-specific DNA methylase
MESARGLGAYYTPVLLARPLCRWAIREATDAVLDPSCGEGAFLVRAVDRLRELGADPRRIPDQVAGVELDARALARAHGALRSRHPGLRWARLAEDDFFRFALAHLGKLSFDAVVGNPPFLRTQGRSAEDKRRALEAARAAGAALTADASAWAPFVAAAAGLVRPGGRLAMIVPREGLFVNYARPLLAALCRRFGRVTLLALDEYWFEGALVKVALLLAEGAGPGTLHMDEPREPGDLAALAAAAPEAGDSWVWARVPAEARPAARRALESPALASLSEIAELSVGVVTGDRDFFLLPPARARALGIPGRYLRPAVSRPAQLAGARFTAEDCRRLEESGAACRLLAIPPTYRGGEPGLDRYLERGRRDGLDRRYKCRTRKPWYAVRRLLEPPHLFLGYLVKRRARWAANLAGAWSTNNVHRLWLRPPWEGEAELVAAAAANAATALSAELVGRVAAGGALKIEPGDAARVRVIRPELLARVPGAAERARAIDRALREGRDGDAAGIADAWAAEAAGWSAEEARALRRACEALRDARLSRA